MTDSPSYPGAPRWAKVFGIILIVLILLFVILLFTKGPGGHGPGRHLRSDDDSGQTAPSGVTEQHRPSGGLGGHTPPEGGHS